MRIQYTRFAARMLVGLTVAAIGFAGSVNFRQGKDRIEVVVNGKPFTTYYFGSNAAKAYLMPFEQQAGSLSAVRFRSAMTWHMQIRMPRRSSHISGRSISLTATSTG
jgi:hypothetical protein